MSFIMTWIELKGFKMSNRNFLRVPGPPEGHSNSPRTSRRKYKLSPVVPAYQPMKTQLTPTSGWVSFTLIQSYWKMKKNEQFNKTKHPRGVSQHHFSRNSIVIFSKSAFFSKIWYKKLILWAISIPKRCSYRFLYHSKFKGALVNFSFIPQYLKLEIFIQIEVLSYM